MGEGSDERIKRAVERLLGNVGIARSEGIAERELAGRERVAGWRIPESVRTLYRSVGAADWERASPGVRLLGLSEMAAHVGPGGETLFAFASGIFGDAIFYVERSAGRPVAGSVLLEDHEMGEVIVLETSLAGWIERLAAYNGTDYAYMMGELPKLDGASARRFLERHAELNPGSELAMRGLFKLNYPDGHPGGYHHWDGAGKRLVPIGEAGHVRHVALDGGSQRDLESIGRAGICERLIVAGGKIEDLSPLLGLAALRELYIYDLKEVDVSPLSGLPELVEVRFLRCSLRRLERLAAAAKLRRLTLNECQFDESALDAVRRGRPGIGIAR